MKTKIYDFNEQKLVVLNSCTNIVNEKFAKTNPKNTPVMNFIVPADINL